MPVCNNVTLIYDTDCVGDSLITINKNFENLDVGLCELGNKLLDLEVFIRSLSAKDSPTIDMSFGSGTTLANYFLSADVVNNSLGTIKLGQDIPDTTKQFLTGAKLQSLLDIDIPNPQDKDLLFYNGNKWIAFKPEDKDGANFTYELKDVIGLDSSYTGLVGGEVLKYDKDLKKWKPGPDNAELRVRDGTYADIIVTGNGALWNIGPETVGTDELADNAVTNVKLATNSITNEKIANYEITKEKCNFDIGEKNDGKNIGGGNEIFASKQGTVLNFRTLKVSGAATISTASNTITINVPNVATPAGAIGQNIGSGIGVYDTTGSTDGNLKFKTLKADSGIVIEDQGSYLLIKGGPVNLGASMLGVDSAGTNLTDAAIIARINNIFPPSSYPSGSKCRVELVKPVVVGASPTVTVSFPFTFSYIAANNKFAMLEPFYSGQDIADKATPTGKTWQTVFSGKGISATTGTELTVTTIGNEDYYFTGSRTFTKTVTNTGSSLNFGLTQIGIKTFTSNGSSWA